MDLLNQFKDFLFLQKNLPAKVTVKNYLSDANHFIRWYEKKFNKSFSPKSITHQTIEQYKTTNSEVFSQSSMDRHLSSLRKFFKFLKLEGQISHDPFQPLVSDVQHQATDPWHIKDFKNFLYVYNASHLTIKNYIIDTRQFFAWAENVTGANDSLDTKDKNILNRIDNSLLEEYKNRLINEGNFSPATVNRKLSSLRKYLNWAIEEKYISDIGHSFSNLQENPMDTKAELQAQFSNNEAKNEELENTEYDIRDTKYSPFPPIRLFQKLSKGIVFAFDQALTIPFIKALDKASYLTWLARGKPVFAKLKTKNLKPKNLSSQSLLGISNIKKEFYAPLEISTKYFPWYKKTWFALRYKRPKWYTTYHSYPIAHYFNFAILTIFMAVIGFGFYQSFFQKPTTGQPALAALPNAPLRILSFQGRLTDNQDNPISTSSALRFAIYNAQAPASGSALLWQEVDSVSPDQDGIFSVLLGNAGDCPVGQTNPTGPCGIPNWLFASNSALFLGVSINTTPEMTPRQQLATVAFAANSETLQGLAPITQSGAGTSNVVLALDSSGNLTIGGSANPIFQASGGQFTMSGQPLLLTTNAGSNGNVTLSADGLGKIAFNKPLISTSNSNNIPSAVGSVEVDGLFSILASSSGQSAFTINQTGGGPLISASQSGTAKFTVDGSGNTTIAAGSIFSVGTAPGLSLTNACVNTTGGIVTGTGTCPNTGTNWWNQLAGALSPVNTNNDFLLGSTATSTAEFAFTGLGLANHQTQASISGQLVISANNGYGGNIIPATSQILTISSNNPGFTHNGYVQINGNITLQAYDQQTLGGETGAKVAVGGSFSGTGGTLQILGGAGGGSGTGGPVTIDAGTGSTNGVITIGTTTASSITIGNSNSNSTTFNVKSAGNYIFQKNGSAYSCSGTDKLTLNVSGQLVCGTDSVGTSTNWWNELAGVLSPIDINDDLAIGGTATSTAEFSFTGIKTGQTIASVSGNLIVVPNNGYGGHVGIGTRTPTDTLDLASLNQNEVVKLQLTEGTGTNGAYVGLKGASGTNDVIQLQGDSNISALRFGLTNGTGLDTRIWRTGIGTLQIDPNGGANNMALNIVGQGGSSTSTVSLYRSTDGFAQIAFSAAAGSPQVTFGSGAASADTRFYKSTTANTLIFDNNASGPLFVGLGVPTSATLSTLDIRGASGTLSVASVSGKTSFVSLVANNDGVGDLFTASASGTNKFAVKNNGTIIAPTYATCTLKTDSNGLFTCGTDNVGSAGVNWWNQLAGALSPVNTTNDFLLGSTATSSALFSYTGIKTGQTIASISGQLIIMANNGYGGKVGIGTTTPKTSLDITGDVRTSQTLAQADYQTDDGLMLYLPLSETSGTTVYDRGPEGTDGIFAHGSTGANPTFTSGKSGNALSFTGTGGASSTDASMVQTALNTTQKAITSITWEAWINSSDITKDQIWMAQQGVSNYFRILSSKLFVSFSNPTQRTLAGSTTLQNNTWYHVAATYDATSGVINIYLNGVLDSTTTVATGNLAFNNNTFQLGALNSAGNYSFGGKIDEARIYDHALDADEIKLQYLRGSQPSTILADTFRVMDKNNDINLYINSGGNVGIGTTAPQGYLHVNGGYSNNAALIVNNLNSGDLFTASASGVTKFTVNNNGNLTFNQASTIQTNTGALTLSPAANIIFGSISQFNNTVSSDITPTTDNSYNLGNSTHAWASLYTYLVQSNGANNLELLAGSTGKLQIDSQVTTPLNTNLTLAPNGTGVIQVNSNILPSATGTLDLGSTTGPKYFRNIYGTTYYSGGTVGITASLGCVSSTLGIVTGSGSCPGGGGVNWWNQLAGALSPVNLNNDLLIGGSSTASADFAFTGLGLANHQTQASFSGQFIVMPNNGYGGNVGIGTTAPLAKLDITDTNSLGIDSPSKITNAADSGFTSDTGHWTTTGSPPWKINIAGSGNAVKDAPGTGILTLPNTYLDSAPVVGNQYVIEMSYSVDASSSGNLGISFGGGFYNWFRSTPGTTGNYNMFVETAVNTNAITISPDSGWYGSINYIYITGLTGASTALRIQSSNGTGTPIEIRPGGSSNNNIYIGQYSGSLSDSNSTNNTAVGAQALQYNTFGGSYNSAFGNQALQYTTNGWGNSGFGYEALWQNTVGLNNSAFGIEALSQNNGSNNTAVGGYALQSNLNGNNNIGIGWVADVGGPNLTNATAIGFRSLAGASNSLVLGSINGINGATASVNVGIGTSTPLTTLDVRGGSGTLAVASVSGKTSFATLVADNSGVGDIFTASASGAPRFTITNQGNVGIGTTAPGYPLSVVAALASSDVMSLNNNAASGQGYASIALQDSNGQQQGFMGWSNYGASRLALSVNLGTVGAYPIVLATNNTERLRIDSSGNVGIGTAAPVDTLDLRGNSGTTAVASISGKTSFAALVVDNSGAGDLITASSSAYGSNPARTQFIVSNTGKVQARSFYDFDNPAFYLDPAATGTSLSVAGGITAGTILPLTDNTYTLGSSPSARWKSLFLGPGSLHIQCLTTDAGCPASQNIDYQMAIDSTGTLGIGANVGAANPADLFITQGGNVGIGTTGPGARLDVASGGNTATSYTASFTSSASVTGAGGILFDQGSTYAFKMYSAGTSATSGSLHFDYINQSTGTASYTDVLSLLNGNLATTGTMGIGTSAPTSLYQLDVAGAPARFQQGIISGYTQTTGAGNTNYWYPIASVSISAQYQYGTADILISKQGAAGAVSDENALVHLQVKQQAAFGSAPIVSLQASYLYGIPAANIVFVLTSNAGPTTGTLYVKNPDAYEEYTYTALGTSNNITISGTNTAGIASLPAGTQTTPTYAYYSYGGSMGINQTSLTSGYKLDVFGGGTTNGGILIEDNGSNPGAKLLSIGDDSYFTDIDVANTVGLYGATNTTIGSLKLGSAGPTLAGTSGLLSVDTALTVAGVTNVNGGLSQGGNVILNGSDTWLRTTGATGWYSATYNGGIYMTAAGAVQVYGVNKFDAVSNSGSGGYISSGNYAGTGTAAWFPSGIYSAGTNWLYGSVVFNGAVSGATSFTCSNCITQADVGASAVGTSETKTGTGSNSTAANTGENITMNDYGFFPSLTDNSVSHQHCVAYFLNVADPGNTIGRIHPSNTDCAAIASTGTAVTRWRYITASDHPTIWSIVDTNGKIINTWEAEDPVDPTKYPENPNPLEGTELKQGQYFLSPEFPSVPEIKKVYDALPATESAAIITNLKNYIVDKRNWLNNLTSIDDLEKITPRYYHSGRQWAYRYLASYFNMSTAELLGQINTVVDGKLYTVADPVGTINAWKDKETARIQKETQDAAVSKSASGSADLAEWYSAYATNLEPGDVLGIASSGMVGKAQEQFSKRIIGVISTSPDKVMGNKQLDSDVSIALNGRVPTKVSSENGPIEPGDPLTISSIPGVAAKAIKAGNVIGKALESYSNTDPTAIGKINVFVNLSWYDPDVYLTHADVKNFSIAIASPSSDLKIPSYYSINDILGKPIERVGIFSEAVIANLKTGAIDAQEIATKSLTINGQNLQDYIAGIVQNVLNNGSYISPIASTDQINTNLISPLATGSAVAIKLDNNKVSILNSNSASGSAVASIDNQGNATFSGQLSASSGQFGDATVSGTLHAGKILASDIVGLNIQAATVSANYITNVTNIYNSTASASNSNFGLISGAITPGTPSSNFQFTGLASSNFINISTFSSQLAYVDNLNAATASFSQGLMVFGPTSLSDTSIVGQLSVDGNLILSSNSINVLGGDLQIQPLKQGGLSVMAGLFYIDTSGNLTVGGDATFAKNVTVKGTLAANTISPIPGNDLTLATGNSNLEVKNASNSSTLSLNNLGDLVASGSGTFGKLNLSLIQPAFALSTTEVVATGSAGTAQINAHQTEITIDNPLVTDKSLIYVTPKSNQVIYLMRQVPGVSFTVGVSVPTYTDIPFNWIIVN